MVEKWCHQNGRHGPHEWKSGLGPIYSCPGYPQEEDYAEEGEDEE